jgi:hypothetical protein
MAMGADREGVAGTPLDALLRAIQDFLEVPSLELTPADLGDHLVRLRHGIDLLELGFATDAATFAATDPCTPDVAADG